MSLTLRTEHGYKYITKLPSRCVSQVRFKTGVELYALKKGKKVWNAGNIELRHGLLLLIYSPYSQRYWYRRLEKHHDIREYRRYIKDGNLYLFWNEIWQEEIKREVEKEGMGYYQYNELRELLLIEPLLKPSEEGYLFKKRAMEMRINELKQLKR